jgi:hypothetical protein
MHKQAIATANALSVEYKAIRADTTKDDKHRRAETWFCAGAFLLALGCIVAVAVPRRFIVMGIWLVVGERPIRDGKVVTDFGCRNRVARKSGMRGSVRKHVGK